ncbi:MAG: DNA repair protein RadA [Burkholderiaceae bacterium]|jgi:DNA repair protein RadA/Sms|nr:DNA repair protein RadA [Burkholderiaceae bacterium]
MVKDKTVYVCNECGASSPRWLGKCPGCGAWNTLIETVLESAAPDGKNRLGAAFAALAPSAGVQALAEIEAVEIRRTPTGQTELDRALGGGIVEGGVVLIGGDPGIGKSTLLLQALDSLQRAGLFTEPPPGRSQGGSAPSGGSVPCAAGERGGTGHAAGPPQGAPAPSGGSVPCAAGERGGTGRAAGPPQGAPAPSGGSVPCVAGERGGTLYVTGEESGAQVALRARRLGLAGSQVAVLAEIQLEKILTALAARQPAVAVIDSIQTVYSDQLTSAPGSVAQVRECAAHLTRWAKASGCAVVLVGHVTKDGQLAGPRVLEHMVDTVLYFEGDTHSSFRLIRAIKNRFGAAGEIGVFAMTERGLKGVSNPSAIFLSQHSQPVPGSCVLAALEGTRPMLVEIQALVDSGGPSPRRLSVGLERDRLAMLLAVLHQHAGVATGDQDVFVNAVGGVRISEPAADLAVLLAITSSLRGKALPKGLIAFGEVGLAGEVRPAPRGQERLKEAAKLGFATAVVPKANAPRKADNAFEGLAIYPVGRVDEAIELVRGLQ